MRQVLNLAPGKLGGEHQRAIWIIEVAQMCRGLQVLPRAGGVLDQDWVEYQELMLGLEALDEKAAAEEAATKAKEKARARRNS